MFLDLITDSLQGALPASRCPCQTARVTEHPGMFLHLDQVLSQLKQLQLTLHLIGLRHPALLSSTSRGISVK